MTHATLKSEAPKLCSECANNRDSCCTLYVDVITGHDVHLLIARDECGGNRWTPRALDEILNGSSTIETPMATIHKDPWDKITKTYE